MTRMTKAHVSKVLAAAGMFALVGLTACEEDADIDVGDAEIELEEDGDININD